MKYRVKLTYLYSDTIEVEAESKDEAIRLAAADEDIDEVFECWHDATAVEIHD